MAQEANAVSCHFFPEFVRIDFEGGASKNVSWADFLADFDNAFKNQRASADEGPKKVSTHMRLPNNVFIMEEVPEEKRLTLSIYYPEVTVDLEFSGDGTRTYKNCPLPNIILTVDLRYNEKTELYALNSCKYFCTSKRMQDLEMNRPITRTDSDNQIWPLALPNMYDNGNMCYGGNSTITSLNPKDLREVEWMYHLIFQSPFNNDLTVPGQNQAGRGSAWLSFLSDQEVFPYWVMYSAPWDKDGYLKYRKEVIEA